MRLNANFITFQVFMLGLAYIAYFYAGYGVQDVAWGLGVHTPTVEFVSKRLFGE